MQPDPTPPLSSKAASLLVPNRTQLAFNFDPPEAESSAQHSLTIRLPPMAPSTRRATRNQANSMASVASESEYHASDASSDLDKEQDPGEQDLGEAQKDSEEHEQKEYGVSHRGRRITKKSYVESSEGEAGNPDDDEPMPDQADNVSPVQPKDPAEEEDDGPVRRYSTRTKARVQSKPNGTVISDDEGMASVVVRRTRSATKGTHPQPPRTNGSARPRRTTRNPPPRTPRPTTRRTRSNPHDPDDDENYVQPSDASADADASADDALPTSPEPEADADDEDAIGEVEEGEADQEQNQGAGPYSLRQRAKINYAIPPPIEEMPGPSKRSGGSGRANGRSNYRGNKKKPPGWSATGAELSRWMGGGAGDDSDSDFNSRPSRKGLGISGGGMFAGSVGNSGGLFPSELGSAGPSNLGKITDSALADVDPLGVNQNVTFDEVGGLDDHVNALKEMTLLPLLYPEVFQRFSVTPPRGVLFHGPPGTGKTLLARALAASCRSNGKGISFFMRKGADILSKWVGEAERQLRLLFEEARNQQPSIIFFDEIDGLAPVRSSKQDQIHASIVSTLLALMDGMDGRGQVVVIGATNRPDAIDPALRRPGRFDREFYFPLPGLEARERILRIMTRHWSGWEDQKGEEHCKGLAKLTKGYGGADLRALCTEAALNSVQRRYPQIYKSNERLLLDPASIFVELRDFMISIRKLIPSSARATASTASPLPSQLVPLLGQCVDRVKEMINKVLPLSKKRNALEEAEWEDEGEVDALDREMMLQVMETLRVHRPRIAIHGSVGLGQEYVAAAALHHLEGYHIQNLDLGTLISDSTRTPESSIVQLFIEAKRHQPSVVYIPALAAWCASVSETARMAVRAMLDSLVPTDPILLLAVVDGSFDSLPVDVRAWFGPMRDHRLELTLPSAYQREEFFEGLLKDISRNPSQFPDGVKRKKRVLEELPIAPPLAPRVPTAAELAVQEENDQRIVLSLQYRLGLVLTELKRKFKRFTKRAADEYNYDFYHVPMQVDLTTTTIEVQQSVPEEPVEVNNVEPPQGTEEPAAVNGISEAPIQMQVQIRPQLFDMDLERMHIDLYKEKYLTPDDFLDDIRKIVHNAEVRADEDPDRFFRAQAMSTAARLSLSELDVNLKFECDRMAVRVRLRREEFKKNREREKAANSANPSHPLATRRSGRHNGLEPEIPITDPLQLERKLKRQRSAEGNRAPSEEGQDREAKRSRMDSAEADERRSTPLPSPTSQRTLAVRFANSIEDQDQSFPQPPTNAEPDIQPQKVDVPRRSGIDDLLNPAPPDSFPSARHSPAPLMSLTPTPVPEDNAVPTPVPHVLLHLEVATIVEQLPLLPPEAPAVPIPDALPMEVIPQVGEDLSQPMQIEPREPTPPPDFILDDYQLAHLRHKLRDSTGSLNIEQLEQLRATCLSAVWRHRTEWNRAPLIEELCTILDNFVEDVRAEYSSP